MHRRGFLKMAAGALSASAAALTVQKGIGLPQADAAGVAGHSAPLVPMQGGTSIAPSDQIVHGHSHSLNIPSLGWMATSHAATQSGATIAFASPPIPGDLTMQFVTGPDPATMVDIVLSRENGGPIVLPSFTMLPDNELIHGLGVRRAEFPEFDPAYGIVDITGWDALIHTDMLAALRVAYAQAVTARTGKPVDGNHLSVRFMPHSLMAVQAFLDGERVGHVVESYSGPNGWLVQMVTHADGEIALFGGARRYQVLTGTVTLQAGGEAIWPGDHTAALLS